MRIQVTVFWVVTLCNDVVSYHDLEFQMFITKWKIYVLTTYLWLSYTTESTAFLFSYFFCSLYLWPWFYKFFPSICFPSLQTCLHTDTNSRTDGNHNCCWRITAVTSISCRSFTQLLFQFSWPVFPLYPDYQICVFLTKLILRVFNDFVLITVAIYIYIQMRCMINNVAMVYINSWASLAKSVQWLFRGYMIVIHLAAGV
jgi:hypothetical protein